jgi:hypothetical protein
MKTLEEEKTKNKEVNIKDKLKENLEPPQYSKENDKFLRNIKDKIRMDKITKDQEVMSNIKKKVSNE